MTMTAQNWKDAYLAMKRDRDDLLKRIEELERMCSDSAKQVRQHQDMYADARSRLDKLTRPQQTKGR